MSVLVLVLTLLFGRVHVYDGVNVGVVFNCNESQTSGIEITGDPGYFVSDDPC